MSFFRLRALFRRSHMECDLRDEMSFHAATARQTVELEATAEACRDARGVSFLENTLRDLRYAARGLWHTPGFTIPALMTLALGLGAAIAIFSVADAVLVQPLAYPGANRLMELHESMPLLLKTPVAFSAPDIAQVQRAGAEFTGVASFEENQRDLVVGAAAAARVRTTRISANLLPLLGISPVLGRNFTARQDQPGQHVAILSNALWKQELGGDPHVLGRTLHLDGVLYTVVGVMPPGFEFPPRGLPDNRPAALFVPMAFTTTELTDLADGFDFGVLARLRPGATPAEARVQMEAASSRILQIWAAKLGKIPGLSLVITVDPLRDLVIGPTRVLMDLLLGAAALLLLLSCANVANLFLVRATTRRREWSLRAALGASGGRLIRQALTESTLLSLVAAAGGLMLAWGALAALTASAPASLPQVREIGLNGWSLLFAAAVALVAGPLCGLLPAHAAARSDLEQNLRADAPSLAGGGSGARARQTLVVAQVAIAFVLVCGAGLLVHSFVQAEAGSSGTHPQGVTTAELLLPQTQYAAAGRAVTFVRELQGRLEAQPGVRVSAVSTALPTEPNWGRIFTVEDKPAPAGTPLPVSKHTLVTRGFFRTLGIPMVEGRDFTPQEVQGGRHVVIVSASIARRYWRHGSAIGQRIAWGTSGGHAPWLTIVGIAGDVKESGLDQPAGLQTYVPYGQMCATARSDDACRNLYLSVQGRDRALLSLPRFVAGVDPEIPVTNVRPLQAVLDASITPRRFNTLLLAVFGLAALLLAGIGLYGVLSFAVAGRKRELAVRMALGAAPGSVVRMVIGIGGRLALAGLLIGALCAWLLSGILHASLGDLLYRTATLDPFTWLAVAAVLLLVALAAAYIPARRASRIAPLAALREN